MVLKFKLNEKSKITVIKTWAVAVFRYRTGILKWKEHELKDVDRKSRKTISDVDRLYIKKKERRQRSDECRMLLQRRRK